MGEIYHAFPPLVGEKPKILILGTFPSPLSREKGEYYGNPRNQFWRLLFGVFDMDFAEPDYEAKKAVLFTNSIALWDVAASCEADGALDTDLRNIIYNTALPEFIMEHGIRKVLFNGNNAYIFYKRGIGAVERNVLPSSSPANARMCFEEKLRLWREGLL
ncbi:MAG: DNA-deoxyinosine glycosylase [Oscillospiraceae bacterium]|jgi:hypoxanthine-DNA glycosylase|nr:DNA-deoxyinosine glycosylase [Oscillospiraceae bacterium]